MRIRTVKPEFWSSATTRSLSIPARLLFIGTWNLADDTGRLIWDADYLRGQLFMSDHTLDVGALMEECVRAQCILPYKAGDGSYAQVAQFGRHQVINRPSKSKLPDPPTSPQLTPTFTEPSVSAPTPLTEPSVSEQGTGNREQGRRQQPVDMRMDIHPGTSSSSNPIKLALTRQVLAEVVDILVDRAKVTQEIRNLAAYRNGVKTNVWKELGPTILSIVENPPGAANTPRTLAEGVLRMIEVPTKPAGAIGGSMAQRDAEVFVCGLWWTGTPPDEIEDALLERYPDRDSDEFVAGWVELQKRIQEADDASERR